MQRLDPVALQAQDFVDEWLTRPWPEMKSRSSQTVTAKLERWHAFLARGLVVGDFTSMQVCADPPGLWQIGLNLNFIDDLELPEPLDVYFLVEQLGSYRFNMIDIRFERQGGCPDESQPNAESISLFPAPSKEH